MKDGDVDVAGPWSWKKEEFACMHTYSGHD